MRLYQIMIPANYSKQTHETWYLTIVERGWTTGATQLKPVWGRCGPDQAEKFFPILIACSRWDLWQILRFTKRYYKQRSVAAWVVSPKVYIQS